MIKTYPKDNPVIAQNPSNLSSTILYQLVACLSLGCLSCRPNSVLDNIEKDQVCAYMYDDKHGMGIIRGKSAAQALLGKPYISHVATCCNVLWDDGVLKTLEQKT